MQKSLLIWFFLLGLCVVTTSSLFAQATQAGQIILARVRGGVTVMDKASKVVTNASNSLSIAQGNTVTTGKDGSVVLVFSNGATINLKPDSVLDIEQYLQDPFSADIKVADLTDEPTVSNTKLNLTRGELVGNVKHLNKAKNSSFSVQTPVGAAGIRGTTFRIVYRPSGNGTAFFSLTTAEGNVELATGTSKLPVAAANGETAKEVVIEVQVNEVTGGVTLTTPAGKVVVVDAPAKSVAAVVQSAVEVAQAVATIVFAPAPTVDPTAVKAAEEKAAAEKKAAADRAAADKKAAGDKAAADKAAAEKKASQMSAPPVVPPQPLTSGSGGTE
jgi:hypothetical protein